tara:strand:+ start:32 stop:1942 length:1911 start_codon:yes stop_codon:yes gene_type:complete
MKNLIYFFLLISFFSFSQEEKRLALVIGNANYDKGELKNPANDAKLIASTLDSIGFDVLLHTNIERRRDFLAAINEFGTKLPNYDVSFVYYAGHGIQINSENFLLPTKEIFEMEIDVEDYGVSVQRILKYIEAKEKEKINILVIDACRDNPFEQSWNNTRSLKGSGLAKLNPPTGSIIAFSTDSGNTAPDGDGENSLYTSALSRNLLKPDTSIEQIFKYVRQDVLEKTNGIQKPIENNTLIGDPYIFNKSNYYHTQNKLTNLILKLEKPWFSSANKIEALNYIKKIEEYSMESSVAIAAKLMCNLSDYDKFLDLYSKIDFDKHDLSYVNFYKFCKANSVYLNDFNEPCPFVDRDKCSQALNEGINIYNELEKTKLSDIFSLENKDDFYRIKYLTTSNDNLFIGLAFNFNKFDYAIKRLENSISYYKKFIEENPSIFNEDPEKDLFAERFMMVTPRTNLLKLKEFSNYDKNMLIQEWRDLYIDFPSDINLLSGRIFKIMSLYEYELARTLINKLIALDPKDPSSYFLLYLIDRSNKDYLSAILNLRYAIERNGSGYYIPSDVLNLNSDYLSRIGNSVGGNNSPLSSFELRLYLIELYKLVGNKNMMCLEYEDLLSKNNEEKRVNKIKDLIIENCVNN